MNRTFRDGVFARAACAGAGLATGLAVLPAAGQSIRSQLVVGQLSQPLDLEAPPGDTARIFIVEQTGKIRIFNLGTGTMEPAPFIDFGPSGLNLIASGGERGLLGLAFDPDFANNGRFYVDYTDTGGAAVIARYTALPPFATTILADTTSGLTIRNYPHPFANHNGGQLQFGPDGMLYSGMGDGGSANDPDERAQNYASPLGKILRFDVNRPADGFIPVDNPYADTTDGRIDEIWAIGVRNPWRFTFDRLTGDLWIADVGQDAREEIDFQPALTAQNHNQVAGRNYGWDCREGLIPTPASDVGCDPNAQGVYTDPIIDYVNQTGGQGNCSISGGVVYRGSAIPALQGAYLYADYCSDFIKSLRYNGQTVSDQREWTGYLSTTAGPINNIVGFGEDASGEVYVVSVFGSIYKIVPDTGNCGCPCLLSGDQAVLFEDHFETDQGWVVTSGGATAGQWQRGIPVNDNNYVSDPVTDSDRSGRCFMTQNTTGTATDVDGGSTILTSPRLDLTSGKITICYDYFLDLGNAGASDGLFVDISVNGNAGPWIRLASHQTDNGLRWIKATVTQDQLDALGVVNSSDVRLRFTATDAAPDSTVEAAVDNITVYTGTVCFADFNLDAFVDGIDYDRFNNAFESNDPAADLNGDQVVDGMDYDAFMQAFENGC